MSEAPPPPPPSAPRRVVVPTRGRSARRVAANQSSPASAPPIGANTETRPQAAVAGGPGVYHPPFPFSLATSSPAQPIFGSSLGALTAASARPAFTPTDEAFEETRLRELDSVAAQSRVVVSSLAEGASFEAPSLAFTEVASTAITAFNVKPLSMITYPIGWFMPGSVLDNLTCSVCFDVVRDPPNLETCRHTVCRSCLTECRKRKNECPVDRIPFRASCTFASNPFVQNVVWQLRVQCPNHESGCAWTASLGKDGRNLEAHHLACEFALVGCGWCKNQFPREDASKHRKECLDRPVQCSYCTQEMPLRVLHLHQATSKSSVAADSGSALIRPPTCSGLEVCPRGCEDPKKGGFMSIYQVSDRQTHASSCMKRLLQCSLCPQPHAIAWDETIAHLTEMMTSPDRATFAIDQVRRLLPGGSSSSPQFSFGFATPQSSLCGQHNNVALRVRHSNKALNNASDRLIQLSHHGNGNQRWNLVPVQNDPDYYYIVSPQSGKALDVIEAGGDGSGICIYEIHGGYNQQWEFIPRGAGYFSIHARHNGKALDVDNASEADGAELIIWPFHGNENQQFRLEGCDVNANGGSSAQQMANPVYNVVLRPKHSMKALDNLSNRGIQRSHHGQQSQRWNFIPAPGESRYFHIVSAVNGKVLDVIEAGGDGAGICVWEIHGGSNQQWEFIPRGAGYFSIHARHNGKALDVAGASEDDGAELIIWPFSGNENQLWAVQA